VLVNAQADAQEVTKRGVRLDRYRKPEISTGRQQLTSMEMGSNSGGTSAVPMMTT